MYTIKSITDPYKYWEKWCFIVPSTVKLGNKPVLVQGQIPVVYDASKSSWVKANINSKWYNYRNQEWANAVTVTETNREIYMNASSGTPISMDDINTMWVWIPRYEYMYTNLGENYAGGTQEQPGEIKVNFLDGKETTPSDSSNYKVHPAFTFGEDEVGGIWYAKFETTGTLSSACTNTSCNASTVTVKPGITSLREQTISSFFYMARSMQLNNTSTYGFSKTDSDLHMSKNSEWGSVAYLSQSKYGKYGNSNYTGANKEVAINPSSSYITGGGTDTSYVTNIAQSTTGNISGIYDMSGCSVEYVMGNYNNTKGNSGFSALPKEKYYDKYTSTTSVQACNNGVCYGHALSETASWYSDYVSGIDANWAWYMRGAMNNSYYVGGIFAIYVQDGGAYNIVTTRLVDVPLK